MAGGGAHAALMVRDPPPNKLFNMCTNSMFYFMHGLNKQDKTY